MAGPSQIDLAIPPIGLDQLPQDIRQFLAKKFTAARCTSSTVYANHDCVRPLQVRQGSILHIPSEELIKANYKLRTGQTDPPFILYNSDHKIQERSRTGRTDPPFVLHDPAHKNQEQFKDCWVYKHPILVLSRSALDPTVIHFCPMTTLRMQKLQECFPDEWQKWQYYMAVDPSGHHPFETHPTLSFDDMRKSKKAGYVRTNAVYSMHYADATRFHDRNSPNDKNDSRMWSLQPKSMEAVLYHVKCHTGYEPDAAQHEMSDEDYWDSLPIYHDFDTVGAREASPDRLTHRLAPRSTVEDQVLATVDCQDAVTNDELSRNPRTNVGSLTTLKTMNPAAPAFVAIVDSVESKQSGSSVQPSSKSKKREPSTRQEPQGNKQHLMATARTPPLSYRNLFQEAFPDLQTHRRAISLLNVDSRKFKNPRSSIRKAFSDTTVYCFAGSKDPSISAAPASDNNHDSILSVICAEHSLRNTCKSPSFTQAGYFTVNGKVVMGGGKLMITSDQSTLMAMLSPGWEPESYLAIAIPLTGVTAIQDEGVGHVIVTSSDVNLKFLCEDRRGMKLAKDGEDLLRTLLDLTKAVKKNENTYECNT